MKKLSVGFVLTLFMITTAAFGGEKLNGPINLVGTWSVTMQIVSVEGYTIEESVLNITDQQGNLFRGHAEPEDPPYTNCYGAIIGRKICITCWDSITSGWLNLDGTRFRFVSQNQQYNPPTSPATCIGIAIRD